jgi:dienelactone hydrolase
MSASPTCSLPHLPFSMNPIIRSLFRGLLVASVSLLGFASGTASPRQLLPVEAFFDDNTIPQMALSPDGNKVAMIAPNNGRYSIALLDLTNGKSSVVVHFKDENIRSVFWKGDDTLMFTSAVEGHEIPLLASTDLQGKKIRRILESRRRQDDFSLFFGSLEDTFPWSDEHILIQGYTAESDPRKIAPSMPRNPTPYLYQVNVKTARRLQLSQLERGMQGGFYDREGNLCLATVVEGTDLIVRSRPANGMAWRDLAKLNPLQPDLGILGLSGDGSTAYVIDYRPHDRGVLRTMATDTGKLGPIIFDPPAGEIRRIVQNRERTELRAIVYEDAKVRYHWLDETWGPLMAALERSFEGNNVTVLNISRDEKRFLFLVSSDRNPGVYYLGDLKGKTPQIQPISAVRPGLQPELMRATTPISFAARDGLTINGYLTLPAGADNQRSAMIVLPHGGPWARDSWRYDREVQFLANRGYAVLQLNFRGSSGYGRAFMDAGDREWAAKMQDDITDGVKWAIAQGHADPERVGIMGASYGGFASLAGVTMTPELYKVGINIVGVAELKLITRYDMRTNPISRAIYSKRVGEGDAFLTERSPLTHVASIRVPTFHAYGRNDPRVEFKHWQVLESALKRHGKTYEVHVEDAEGHGFEKAEAAIKLYKSIDAFLAKYLPADVRS